MANTRKKSGGEEIARAKELFEESLSKGKPDFRYVVLAIGAAPASPPRWAIIECLLEFEQTLRLASAPAANYAPENDPHKMMDAVALAYLKEYVRQEYLDRADRVRPPLRQMIRNAYEALALKSWPHGNDGDSYKQWERKWDDEQRHARIEDGRGYELFDLRITPRIEDVITSFTAREMNFFERPERAAYVFQQLVAPKCRSDD